MDDLFSRLTHTVSRSRLERRATNKTPVPYAPRESDGLNWFGSNGTSDVEAVADRAYAAYGSVGTLFAIVRSIGDAFASADWHLYRKGPARDKMRRKEVTSHAFLDIWEKPNKHYTGRFFRETVQQHLDLVGEGVIVLWKIGPIVMEMWAVRPDRITPIKDPDEYIVGYVYTGPNGEQVPLTLDQVIRIMYPNPKDPYRGMGAVQTVLNDIDAAQYSAEWNKNFFVNGARPGGIITVDHRMTDSEFKDFVKRWRGQHQGVANAHRVAVLENATWQDTQFSMSDMQFVELRNLPRELIREAFTFPKPMLGTVDDVNRANADAGKEIMADNLTIPRLKRWRDIVNAFLLVQFANGNALELDFDDPTPLNHEAENAKRDSKTSGAQKLVAAGYHPDDVADAMELPRMRYVGTPQQPAPSDEESTARKVVPAQAKRKPRELVVHAGGEFIHMPIIDSVYV